MINKRGLLVAAAAMMVPRAAFAAEMVRVPLGRNSDGAPTVDLVINEQGPFTFEVDVGSGVSTIGRPLANRLNMKLIGDALQPFIVYFNARKLEGVRVNAVTATFGGTLTRHNVVFMRLPHGPDGTSTSNSSYEGMIGNSLFLAKPCILDLEANELRIYPDGNLPLDGFQAVAGKVSHSGVYTSAIMVAARLGDLSLTPALQTSGLDGIFLSSAFVKKHGLWDRFPDFTERPRAGLGIYRTAWVDGLSIGPFSFDRVRLTMGDPEIDDHSEDADCFVGLDIVSQFTIAFGAKSQLALKPNTSFTGRMVAV